MNDKLLLKAAFLVFQKLSLLNKNISIEFLERLTKLAEDFRNMSLDAKRLALSLNRNWLFAAKRCQENIITVLDEIPYKISTIKQLTDNNTNEETAVTVSQIYQELKQIQQEFAGLNYNKEKKIIAVITKPITLEDVYLGPFQVELHINKLNKLYNECPYYCVALEPNPAANNEEVTHPHISGERLCEGEGSAPIRAALEQGRLYDFFSVVNNILNTYSPDSPYVSLDEWLGGADCYDCGVGINNDDSYYCGFCDRVYCCECSSYCKSCDETICLGCGGSCPNCQEFICKNCLKKCPECGDTFCQLCLEEDVCKNCKEQIETEELENIKNETDRKQDNFKMAG